LIGWSDIASIYAAICDAVATAPPPMVAAMFTVLALTLDQAKGAALVAVILLVLGAVASAWLMKTLVQKAVVALILILVALLVWTQRASLDECADKVKTVGFTGETTCTFFGNDINISAPNSN
jgi:O-antigen ligase